MTGRRRKTPQPADDSSSWEQAELQEFVRRRVKQMEAEGLLDPETDDDDDEYQPYIQDDPEPDWLRNLSDT